ncbi:unnamed protein product [Orchesella dallaii]|uniref:Diacylglycerol O-acyltransferase n=1 Tax=Orchesella dallaii TaxID=48710 RepID=A0ABP1Q8R2_9HEXA
MFTVSKTNFSDVLDLKWKLRSTIAIICGALCCVVFSIFVALSIPIYLSRFVIALLAKFLRPDFGEMLNSLSTIFSKDLFSGKSPRCNVIVRIILKGRLTPEQFKALVLERWINAVDNESGKLIYPELRQYACHWLGFMFWKHTGDKFDLDHHIRYHENLAGTVVPTEQVDELIEQLINKPFKPETSPWELHYVANYENTDDKQLGQAKNEPMCAIVFKIHHSLGDGYSILSAIVEGLGGQSLDELKLPLPQSLKKTWSEWFFYVLTLPFSALCEFSAIFAMNFQECAWKVPDDRKTWWQLYRRSESIPIECIKDIKNAFGVSFTSVLLSAISSGIHQELKDRKKMLKCHQTSMQCSCAIPLLGDKRRRQFTNRVTTALIEIPTVGYPDPVSRLRACHALLETSRNSVIPYLARFYGIVLGCHLTSVCKLIGKNKMVSTGLSNFPSLPVKVGVGNTKAVAVDFACGTLEGDVGAGFMVLSYGDHIRFAVTAEKALMSREQIDNLLNYVLTEISILHGKSIVRKLG